MKHDIRIDVSKLHPYLQYKLKILMNKCEKQNIYLIITEGYRTKEYQDQLYAKGRTTGKIGETVTNARGSDYSSQHQWGIAFDIAIANPGHTWDTSYFVKVSNIAKGIGLGWGGDWTSPVDKPHFYLKKWGSTPTPLKRQYGTFENFKKTWTAKVTRKKGLNIWTKHFKKKKKLLKYGTTVDVLWKHLVVSKVKYGDTIGFVRSKYIK